MKVVSPEKTTFKKPNLIKVKRVIFASNVGTEDDSSTQYTLSDVHGLPCTLTDPSLVLLRIGG